MITIMVREITIDAAGRLVVPKAMRDRLHLYAGARLFISEEAGRLVLSPQRPEPRLVDRSGVLGVEVGAESGAVADHVEARDDRLRELVSYALRR